MGIKWSVFCETCNETSEDHEKHADDSIVDMLGHLDQIAALTRSCLSIEVEMEYGSGRGTDFLSFALRHVGHEVMARGDNGERRLPESPLRPASLSHCDEAGQTFIRTGQCKECGTFIDNTDKDKDKES